MVKRVFLLAGFFCSTIFLQAQTYTPVLDSLNIWYYTYNGCVARPAQAISLYTPCNYSFPGPTGYSIQFTGQDTIINGYTYRQLVDSGGGMGSCEFGYVREDTALRKVYFKDVLGAPEIILYVFSLALGDSFPASFYYSSQGYSYFEDGLYTLDSVIALSINGVVRNSFYLNCDTCTNSRTLIWIEGIGSLGSFVYPYSVYYCAPPFF